MEGERIVFTHEIEPSHGVRVLASGNVDSAVLDALDVYVNQQRERFAMVNTSVLINSGFSQLPARRFWYSHERRMAFSHQFVRERDPAWVNHHLDEKVPETDFVFHCVQVPEDIQVFQEILSEIGLPKLRAYVRIANLRTGA